MRAESEKQMDREQVDTGEERLRDEQIAEGQVVDEGKAKNRSTIRIRRWSRC